LKFEKTLPVPATIRTVTDHYTCDLCGKSTRDTDNWCGDAYAADEVCVSMRIGTNYPEGGSSEETIFDICPDCFKQKLMPFLHGLGAKSRTEDHEY
jgi:hypothetical protein